LALDILVADKNLKLFIDPGALSLLTRISDFLAERGIQSYLTGGFVRDVLLERDTADIDIALTADALEIAPEVATTLGGKYVLLDEVHRVGRVVIASQGAPSARGRWEIDLATVEADIEQDLGRRDFTINAMAVDLAELAKEQVDIQLIDPFHGWDDLHHGVIRAVTDTALASDAVRLLRAVRLAAELGFGIANETELLIRRDGHLINMVAPERIREELLRLLAQDSKFLRYLDTLGLLTIIIHELAQLKGAKQPREHFWDVFDHSLETVAAVDFLLRQGTLEYATDQVLSVVPWSPALAEHFAREVSSGSTRRSLLKLAALLHDIAKPQTRAIEENGRVRFLGHAKQGAAIVVNILQRLRFSTREVRLVEAMVRYHLRPSQMSREQLPTHRAIYRYFRDTSDAGVDTLFLNLADHLATRGPLLDLNGWQEHAQMASYVLAKRLEPESAIAPPRLIDGHDLINVLGMSPGPKIGELLESVREAQAAGEVMTREQALAYARHQLTEKGLAEE
jgi:poly(A) polymerase